MDQEPRHVPETGPDEGPPLRRGGHDDHACPFVQLVTPEVVAQIEDAIAVARNAGCPELSDRLDAWLVRVTRVVETVRVSGECDDCGSEIWLG